jgi:REP element-mobilizing transposase RayT
MASIIARKGHKLIAINGMPDHVHVFIGVKPDESLSKLVADLKSNSSRFVNQKKLTRGRFAWQLGYGAFSYSRSQLSTVASYIENQQKHHAKKSFREEYLGMLKGFEIEFDDRYVFEWI